MAIRLEDRGITLRLFPSEQEARKAFGAHIVTAYGPGWLAQNGAGKWFDEDGLLAATWRPAQDHLQSAEQSE